MLVSGPAGRGMGMEHRGERWIAVQGPFKGYVSVHAVESWHYDGHTLTLLGVSGETYIVRDEDAAFWAEWFLRPD